MPYKEQYMDEVDKPRQWLKELEGFIRHSDISASDLKSSALLVIDMQKFFVSESSHAFVPSSRNIISNINQLITAYAGSDLPVIFTRYALAESEDPGNMAKWWREILKDNAEDAALYPEIIVPENSSIIRKKTYDSFLNTNLKELLLEKSISTVVITGVMTHLCCETTARSAFGNDFRVYFVIDGNATINKELHKATLRTLADGFAVLVTADELTNKLREIQGVGDESG